LGSTRGSFLIRNEFHRRSLLIGIGRRRQASEPSRRIILVASLAGLEKRTHNGHLALAAKAI
jgi:hypothetical protein